MGGFVEHSCNQLAELHRLVIVRLHGFLRE
jgi:hypothetical protein